MAPTPRYSAPSQMESPSCRRRIGRHSGQTVAPEPSRRADDADMPAPARLTSLDISRDHLYPGRDAICWSLSLGAAERSIAWRRSARAVIFGKVRPVLERLAQHHQHPLERREVLRLDRRRQRFLDFVIARDP